MRINHFQHVFHRAEHIIVPEPDYTNVCGLKNFRSFFVILSLLFVVMPTAIKFNSKSSIMTEKIKDISTNWILPAKLETAETAPSQNIPQQFFSVSLALTKLPGKNEQFWWYWQHGPLTLTLSLMERG
jgi:hypothetical protein